VNEVAKHYRLKANYLPSWRTLALQDNCRGFDRGLLFSGAMERVRLVAAGSI